MQNMAYSLSSRKQIFPPFQIKICFGYFNLLFNLDYKRNEMSTKTLKNARTSYNLEWSEYFTTMSVPKKKKSVFNQVRVPITFSLNLHHTY